MGKHPLIGQTVPTLTLPNYDGEEFILTPGANGVPTAIFFYPKSGTYGCTKEACEFRDALADKPNFKDSKIEVVGISADSVEDQRKFVEKHKLTYPVLSDARGEARKAYNVGKGLLGITDARVTFFVDKTGTVRDVLDTTINFGAHSKFVAKWLETISAEERKAAAEQPAQTESTEAEAAAPGPAE
ncbi:peroxiredoxin Q [Neolentinus lepideus HHB14362 ss-1]|uniref:thioredoxin-dependent peroxiredoxin n=1 Tax=Neolentinus lepideus HHB14362 ss-1 TaxID=1314782 RepID=A0A165NC04_9AGAM|nr:peroxiredoxin Q [Neolentinus lepideus HHB14362 ss-1]